MINAALRAETAQEREQLAHLHLQIAERLRLSAHRAAVDEAKAAEPEEPPIVGDPDEGMTVCIFLLARNWQLTVFLFRT